MFYNSVGDLVYFNKHLKPIPKAAFTLAIQISFPLLYKKILAFRIKLSLFIVLNKDWLISAEEEFDFAIEF